MKPHLSRKAALAWVMLVGVAALAALLARDIVADDRDTRVAMADPRGQGMVRAYGGRLVKARILCPGPMGVAVLLDGAPIDMMGVEDIPRYELVRGYCAGAYPGYENVEYHDLLGFAKASLSPDRPLLRILWILPDIPDYLRRVWAFYSGQAGTEGP